MSIAHGDAMRTPDSGLADSEAPWSVIVARDTVSLFIETKPGLQKLFASLEKEGVLRRYPDGSLLAEGDDASRRLFGEAFEPYPELGRLAKSDSYRSLAPFV